jgi:hypothetical protein
MVQGLGFDTKASSLGLGFDTKASSSWDRDFGLFPVVNRLHRFMGSRFGCVVCRNRSHIPEQGSQPLIQL